MRLSKLVVAALVAAAGLIGFVGAADAAPVPTSAVVSCANGDGVMSLTITNPAADAGAEFVVTNPQTFDASVVDLPAGASQLVTIGGLPDGSVVVPVQLNGTDASVVSQISCDAPVCTDGVLSLVTDESGVQHQACVASAAGAPVAPPARAALAPPAAHTTSANIQATLPTTGAGSGGLVVAAALVGSGSLVSLLSRRRPVARRKGFRRRRLTS
ncbi:MAG: hypothetical protein ACXV5U_06645 [Ilumatobacteraceae bacterium]